MIAWNLIVGIGIKLLCLHMSLDKASTLACITLQSGVDRSQPQSLITAGNGTVLGKNCIEGDLRGQIHSRPSGNGKYDDLEPYIF